LNRLAVSQEEGIGALSRHPFDLLVQLHSEQIRLDCAALHLARDFYPHIDVARYLAELDALAAEVAARRPGLAATLRYQAMRYVLFGRHGLTGNKRDYFDPQNSYLNRVLDRHLGIPITLSVVWIEVGRRLKWPVSGVALPGHFLVRFDDPEQYVLTDPFNGGRSLSLDDCRSLVAAQVERPIRLARRHLEPVATRAILSRMLRNLRRLYLSQSDWRHLATVLQRLSALEPRNGRHLQDLAAVYAQLGDVRGAYGCLRAYVDRLPNASDLHLVRANLERLEAAIAALN
jgi:regulator of sirC expression with transglutaminase-like and TPR domain